MGHFRRHMRKARAILHERMKVPVYAFYVPPVLPDIYEVSVESTFPAFVSDPTQFVAPNDEVLLGADSFFGKFHVRVHEKWLRLGDLKGTNFHYAEIEETNPKIILWRDDWREFEEMGLKFQGLILSLEKDLAYQIDTIKPDDDQTYTANAFRLERRKTAGFPVPGDE